MMGGKRKCHYKLMTNTPPHRNAPPPHRLIAHKCAHTDTLTHNPDRNPNCQKNKIYNILFNASYHSLSFHIIFGWYPLLIPNIGLRQGKIIAKIGITLLLLKYNFECLDTKEIEFENHSVVLVPRNGINLRVTNRPLDSVS